MHTEIYEARKQIILDFMNDRQYRPMKLKEMCNILGVPRREREELKLVLDQLISEHEIDIDTAKEFRKLLLTKFSNVSLRGYEK